MEIRKRALRVINKTNIIFQHEVMSLNNGLDDEGVQRAFSIALYNLLFDGGELRQRFEAFSRVLENAGADKWPVMSYFLFILFPDKYMFVKPTIMQHLSDLCRFNNTYPMGGGMQQADFNRNEKLLEPMVRRWNTYTA